MRSILDTTRVFRVLVCPALLVAGLLGGCVSEKAAYEAAVAEGTSDALRDFLEAHPDGMYAASARPELDDLAWEEAKATDSPDALEQYLTDYPEGLHVEEAAAAAPKALWRDMDLANDAAAIEGFLEKYPNSAYATQAQQRLALLKKVPSHLAVGQIEVAPSEQGGWILSCPVENVGDVELVEVEFRVAFLGEDDAVVAETEVFLVEPAPADASDGVERYDPLKPGQSRSLVYDLVPQKEPDGWVGDAAHVRLVVSKLIEAS